MIGAAKGCVKTASSAAADAVTPTRERTDRWVNATPSPSVAGTASTDAKKTEIPPQHQNITDAGTEKVPAIATSAAPACSARLPPAAPDAAAINQGTAASTARTA